ncbi:hypothetical protein [Spirosoma sp.]|uniref:hypothetical protein n=1 Tax=Spirosoma sp. TaxID=1899569 RepID=UPI003B3B3FC3
MNFSLLLQHVVDKSAAVAIAHDSSGTASLIQAIIMSLATGVTGFLVHSFIKRPAEKVEQYEAAEIKAIRDSLNEFKASNRQEKAEWHTWRDQQSQRTTTLELQHKALSETLGEKIKELTSEVADTKEITQGIRETLVGLNVKMEQTITRWIK